MLSNKDRRRRLVPVVNVVKRRVSDNKHESSTLTSQTISSEASEKVSSTVSKISSPVEQIASLLHKFSPIEKVFSPKRNITSPAIISNDLHKKGGVETSENQIKKQYIEQKCSLQEKKSSPVSGGGPVLKYYSPKQKANKPIDNNLQSTFNEKVELRKQISPPSGNDKKQYGICEKGFSSPRMTAIVESSSNRSSNQKVSSENKRVPQRRSNVKKTSDGNTKIFILSPAELKSMGINLDSLEISDDGNKQKDSEESTLKSHKNIDIKKTLFNKIISKQHHSNAKKKNSNKTNLETNSQKLLCNDIKKQSNIERKASNDNVNTIKNNSLKQITISNKNSETRENIKKTLTPTDKVQHESLDMETAVHIKNYLIFSPKEEISNYIEGYKNINKPQVHIDSSVPSSSPVNSRNQRVNNENFTSSVQNHHVDNTTCSVTTEKKSQTKHFGSDDVNYIKKVDTVILSQNDIGKGSNSEEINKYNVNSDESFELVEFDSDDGEVFDINCDDLNLNEQCIDNLSFLANTAISDTDCTLKTGVNTTENNNLSISKNIVNDNESTELLPNYKNIEMIFKSLSKSIIVSETGELLPMTNHNSLNVNTNNELTTHVIKDADSLIDHVDNLDTQQSFQQVNESKITGDDKLQNDFDAKNTASIDLQEKQNVSKENDFSEQIEHAQVAASDNIILHSNHETLGEYSNIEKSQQGDNIDTENIQEIVLNQNTTDETSQNYLRNTASIHHQETQKVNETKLDRQINPDYVASLNPQHSNDGTLAEYSKIEKSHQKIIQFLKVFHSKNQVDENDFSPSHSLKVCVADAKEKSIIHSSNNNIASVKKVDTCEKLSDTNKNINHSISPSNLTKITDVNNKDIPSSNNNIASVKKVDKCEKLSDFNKNINHSISPSNLTKITDVNNKDIPSSNNNIASVKKVDKCEKLSDTNKNINHSISPSNLTKITDVNNKDIPSSNNNIASVKKVDTCEKLSDTNKNINHSISPSNLTKITDVNNKDIPSSNNNIASVKKVDKCEKLSDTNKNINHSISPTNLTKITDVNNKDIPSSNNNINPILEIDHEYMEDITEYNFLSPFGENLCPKPAESSEKEILAINKQLIEIEKKRPLKTYSRLKKVQLNKSIDLPINNEQHILNIKSNDALIELYDPLIDIEFHQLKPSVRVSASNSMINKNNVRFSFEDELSNHKERIKIDNIGNNDNDSSQFNAVKSSKEKAILNENINKSDDFSKDLNVEKFVAKQVQVSMSNSMISKNNIRSSFEDGLGKFQECLKIDKTGNTYIDSTQLNSGKFGKEEILNENINKSNDCCKDLDESVTKEVQESTITSDNITEPELEKVCIDEFDNNKDIEGFSVGNLSESLREIDSESLIVKCVDKKNISIQEITRFPLEDHIADINDSIDNIELSDCIENSLSISDNCDIDNINKIASRLMEIQAENVELNSIEIINIPISNVGAGASNKNINELLVDISKNNASYYQNVDNENMDDEKFVNKDVCSIQNITSIHSENIDTTKSLENIVDVLYSEVIVDAAGNDNSKIMENVGNVTHSNSIDHLEGNDLLQLNNSDESHIYLDDDDFSENEEERITVSDEPNTTSNVVEEESKNNIVCQAPKKRIIERVKIDKLSPTIKKCKDDIDVSILKTSVPKLCRNSDIENTIGSSLRINEKEQAFVEILETSEIESCEMIGKDLESNSDSPNINNSSIQVPKRRGRKKKIVQEKLESSDKDNITVNVNENSVSVLCVERLFQQNENDEAINEISEKESNVMIDKNLDSKSNAQNINNTSIQVPKKRGRKRKIVQEKLESSDKDNIAINVNKNSDPGLCMNSGIENCFGRSLQINENDEAIVEISQISEKESNEMICRDIDSKSSAPNINNSSIQIPKRRGRKKKIVMEKLESSDKDNITVNVNENSLSVLCVESLFQKNENDEVTNEISEKESNEMIDKNLDSKSNAQNINNTSIQVPKKRGRKRKIVQENLESSDKDNITINVNKNSDPGLCMNSGIENCIGSSLQINENDEAIVEILEISEKESNEIIDKDLDSKSNAPNINNTSIQVPKKRGRKRKIVQEKLESSDEEIPLSSIVNNGKLTCVDNDVKLISQTKPFEKGKRGRKPYKHLLAQSNVVDKVEKIGKKGKIQCGVCKAMLTRNSWNTHSLNKHYYLAWIEGEKELDLKDQNLVGNLLTRAAKILKKLQCSQCGEKRASAVGYISHINTCKKTPEEIEAYKIVCQICNMRVFPSSFPYHMTKHAQESIVEPEIIEEEPTLPLEESFDSKRKRKAATVAEDMFKKISTDTVQPISNNNNHLYTRGSFPKVTKRLQTIWKNQISLDNKAMCTRRSCPHIEDNINDMTTHYLTTCKYLVKKPFTCKVCKYECEEECIMSQHVTSQHAGVDKADLQDYEEDVEDVELSSSCNEYTDTDDLSDSMDNCNESKASTSSVKRKSRPRKSSNYDGSFRFSFDPHKSNESKLRKSNVLWMEKLKKKICSFEKLFSEYQCNNFKVVNEDEMESYLPDDRESCSVAHLTESSAEVHEIHWTKYKLFQSELSNGIQTFWCGGSIHSVDILPSSYENAFIAVASTKNLHDRYSEEESYTHKGLLQIWDLGPLNNKNYQCMSPAKMALGIAHDHGVVWELCWCPSGCDDYVISDEDCVSNRMGLLAMACSDGRAYIYAVCHPDTLPNSNVKLYKTDPVVTLSLIADDDIMMPHAVNYQATKICWSLDGAHNTVVVGYSSGMVAYYNIATKSSLLSKKHGSTVHILPYKVFQAQPSRITGLALLPQMKASEKAPLVVASHTECNIWRDDYLTYSRTAAFTGLNIPFLFPEIIHFSEQVQPSYSRAYSVPLGLNNGSECRYITSEDGCQVGCLMQLSSTMYAASYKGQVTKRPYKSSFISRHRHSKASSTKVLMCWYTHPVSLDSKNINLASIKSKNKNDKQTNQKSDVIDIPKSVSTYDETIQQYGLIIVDVNSNFSKANRGNVFMKIENMRMWPLWEQLCIKSSFMNPVYSSFGISGSRAGFCRNVYVSSAQI